MPSRQSFDLNLFVVLEALLRHRSVSRAAEALGVGQSAVSKDLNRLRSHFGDRLFLKTREGMSPTEKALGLAPDVTRLVGLAEQSLLARRSFEPRTAERVIRLVVTDMAELAVLPALIERLRRTAPHCRLEAIDVPGGEQELLQAGRADLAITGPLKAEGEIRQQKLFEHRYVVIVHRDCPIQGEITLEQFAGLDLVLVPPTRSHRVTVPAALARQGLRPTSVVTTPHWLVIPHIVGASPGSVSIVPQSLADLYGGFANIRTLRPQFELPKIVVLQYWHARADGDEFNTWLRGQVREALYRIPTLHIP